MSGVALIVIAKAPAPGLSKTRLCPPCTPREAATLAEAALADTLTAVAATPVARRVLVLHGELGSWLPPGFEVVPQVAGDLGERLAGAFDAVDGPALLVGMDTPQITPELLTRSAVVLARADAVLGAAPDGGYWAIGLRRPDARVFDAVPMSSPLTARVQRARLHALGLQWRELESVRDVDTIEDARAVAAVAPWSQFARALATVGLAPLAQKGLAHTSDGEHPVPEALRSARLESPYGAGERRAGERAPTSDQRATSLSERVVRRSGRVRG